MAAKKKTAKTARRSAAKTAPAKPAAAVDPITVARTGDAQEVAFTKGMTVNEALNAAGYTFNTADEVRVNNVKIKSGEAKLKPGDTVLVLGKIRGA